MADDGTIGEVKAVEHAEEIAEAEPAADMSQWTDADLAAMMKRAVRNTGLAGAAIALVLWPLAGWQTGALFAVGGAISVLSIYEWGRMTKLLTARMDGEGGSSSNSGLGIGRVVSFFLLRMILFAGGIYVSLKCLHGSPIALISGLGLGLAGLAWEAVRTLRRKP